MSERVTEQIQVQLPSPLEVRDLRAYPAEIIRAVAEAANNAGLAGKRIDGLVFDNGDGIMPRIEFEVSKRAPGWIGAGFSSNGIEFDVAKADADSPRITLDWKTVLEMHAKYASAPLSSEPASGDNTTA